MGPPVQFVGHATLALLPLSVGDNDAAQGSLDTDSAGQTALQLSLIDVHTPLVHVALTRPAQPLAQEIFILLPLTVCGKSV
jgi:hypothetical protein